MQARHAASGLRPKFQQTCHRDIAIAGEAAADTSLADNHIAAVIMITPVPSVAWRDLDVGDMAVSIELADNSWVDNGFEDDSLWTSR